MKKLLLLFIGSVALLSSCDSAKMYDAVVVEQINITNDGQNKYEVKLKTTVGDAYYYTNNRLQVGDTLVSYLEYFSGKSGELSRLKKQNDSLIKELQVTKYYLELFNQRVIFDSIKRK